MSTPIHPHALRDRTPLLRSGLAALLAVVCLGATAGAASAKLTISSPVMKNGGTLPTRFTCDGAGISPPIAWATPPRGTTSFAVVMQTPAAPARVDDPPTDDPIHASLLRYALPSSLRKLTAGQTTVGSFGTNSVNGQNSYAPPCSQGPGAKQYIFTVFALKTAPTFAAGTAVTRKVLLAAISKTTLGSAVMTVTYTRP